MRISHRVALVGSFLLVCLTCSSQAEPVVETIDLEHIRPDEIVDLFAPAYEPGEEDAWASHQRVAINFALDAIARAAGLRPGPERDVLPVEGASAVVLGDGLCWSVRSQSEGIDLGAARGLLPDGLAGLPKVVPGRNAVMVKGTREAVDEFREMVKGTPEGVDEFGEIVVPLDTPRRNVELRVGLYEFEQRTLREVLPEMHAWGSQGDAGFTFGLGKLALVEESADRAPMARTMAESRVTVADARPAFVCLGEILAFPSREDEAIVWYDASGKRHAKHLPEVVFAGLSLWVYAHIYPDDTVQLFVRRLALGASGKPADIGAQHISSALPGEAMVRVADGESLVIGGLRARLRDQLREADAGEIAVDEALESIITLTPYVMTPGQD